uniref:alpha-ketoglutarate-dependent dioxygenase alkB homolog 4 isoform X2 n=1 Tax=Myxine glutinosa TaxID=7769 RepID=UPI00358E5553
MTTCGCKGVRSCLVCEHNKEARPALPKETVQFDYNHHMELAVAQIDTEVSGKGSLALLFPGVFLWTDFLTPQEEKSLVLMMDKDEWKPSQSGRRKQDYGPKVNFKKQRVRAAGFSGLPSLSRPLLHRMNQIPILHDFKPVEQCHLEYDPCRGSAIDPHTDDAWLWGERLVTLNLLSTVTLTFTRGDGEPVEVRSLEECVEESGPRRHLDDVTMTYNKKASDSVNDGFISTAKSRPISSNTGFEDLSAASDGEEPLNVPLVRTPNSFSECSGSTKWLAARDVCVRLPVPPRSLMVLSGPARHQWLHGVRREDVCARRVCVTFRELSPAFCAGGVHENEGNALLQKALSFRHHHVS